MLGHWLAYLVCLTIGHSRDLMFERRTRSWRCDRCMRRAESATFRRAA